VTQKSSNVEIAHQDLADSLDKLNKVKDSPSETRKAFYQFVNLSQKVTSYMRTEYKEQTGKKWEAKNFDGWNLVTDLFKELRTIDEHDEPIVLKIFYTWHYRGFGISIRGYWEWDNPLDEFPNNSLEASAPNHQKGGVMEVVKPEEIEYEYVLLNDQSKVKLLMEEIGCSDIHELSKSCFEIMDSYIQFYGEKLAEG